MPKIFSRVARRRDSRRHLSSCQIKYLQTGVPVPQADVVDTSIYPRPQTVMSSGVEGSKPRHFLDARWVKLTMVKFPFK